MFLFDSILMSRYLNTVTLLSISSFSFISSQSPFGDLANVVTDVVVMEKGKMGQSESLATINKRFADGLLGFYHKELAQSNG